MERRAKDGTYYRQVGEDAWEPVTRKAKDGTIYKKVGEDDWSPLSANEPAEKQIYGIPESTVEGTLQALPAAGGLGGGLLGSALGPIGAVGGAGAGAAGGAYLANAIRSGLGMSTAPKTREAALIEPVKEGLIGAAGEGAGQLIKPGLKFAETAAKKGYGTVKGLLGSADDIIQPPKFVTEGFRPSLKDEAQQIAGATERIGARATPGMLSSNRNIQNLESVLSQSPTMSGERVRQAYEPVFKGLGERAEQLAPMTSMSRGEAGEQLRRGLLSRIGEKSQPLSASFQDIQQSTSNIVADPKSLGRAADRLLKQDVAEFATLPQGQAVRKYADLIRGAKSVDSLKQLRSSVNSELSTAYDAGDSQLARALEKVKNSITRLERRQILKTAIESTPTRNQGEAAAKELISQIKQTNKGWRSMMEEMEGIARAGGIKKITNPQHLAKLIDEMPAPQLADRFFNTKNYEGLRSVKQFVPEEFELLRQHKVSQIAEKSLTKGSIDPAKLVKQMSSLDKEAREILFGPKSEQMLSDMKTVLNAIPEKVGKSDTPRGQQWFKFSQLLNPKQWGQEASDAYSYMLLEGRAPPTAEGLGYKAGKATRKFVGSKVLGPKVTRPAGVIGVRGLLPDSTTEANKE